MFRRHDGDEEVNELAQSMKAKIEALGYMVSDEQLAAWTVTDQVANQIFNLLDTAPDRTKESDIVTYFVSFTFTKDGVTEISNAMVHIPGIILSILDIKSCEKQLCDCLHLERCRIINYQYVSKNWVEIP